MALVTSQSLKEARSTMTDPRIAEKDIIERNALGQDVVVVPAGQPIPPELEVAAPVAPKSKSRAAARKAEAADA